MAKVKKGVWTQGTKSWIKHGPDDSPTLTRMDCIKGIDLGDDSTNEIDSTCLDEEDSTTEYGLNKPGEGSLTIDTDPKNQSHMTLLELAEERETVEVYIGWSDDTTAIPTLESPSNVVNMPESRTWSVFTAKLKASPPKFDADSLVNHTIGMKRQTKVYTNYRTIV